MMDGDIPRPAQQGRTHPPSARAHWPTGRRSDNLRIMQTVRWKAPVTTACDEAEAYRGRTPQEAADDLAAVCAAGAGLLAARGDLDRVMAFQDPLPASTVALLARLRAQMSRATR